MKHAALLVLLAACHAAAPARPLDNQGGPSAEDAPIVIPPDPRVAQLMVAARAARDAGDRAACVEQLVDIDERWLGSASQGADALALMKDCSGRTEDGCDYYAEGMNDGGDPYCVLSLAVELGPRVAYADATATACGFGDIAGAIAIPGDADRCLALTEGNGIPLDDLPEDGHLPPGTCPSVIAVERHGGKVTTLAVEHDGSSFIDDASTCCNATELRVRRRGAALEVMIESGGPSRDCFGGTASVDHLEVYRLDGAHLVSVADLGVGMH